MSELDSKDIRKQKLVLQKRYEQRITTARHGREAFSKKDYVGAARKYNEYLLITILKITNLKCKHSWLEL